MLEGRTAREMEVYDIIQGFQMFSRDPGGPAQLNYMRSAHARSLQNGLDRTLTKACVTQWPT